MSLWKAAFAGAGIGALSSYVTGGTIGGGMISGAMGGFLVGGAIGKANVAGDWLAGAAGAEKGCLRGRMGRSEATLNWGASQANSIHSISVGARRTATYAGAALSGVMWGGNRNRYNQGFNGGRGSRI